MPGPHSVAVAVSAVGTLPQAPAGQVPGASAVAGRAPRTAPEVSLRLRVGLVAAGALLVAATGWRAAWLQGSRPSADVSVVSVDADSLGGGLLLSPSPEGWTVTSLRTGELARALPGTAANVGGLAVEVDDGGGLRRTGILRAPWEQFAGEAGGFVRIDFGADPLGTADSVRDRVVLPISEDGGRAWFHLAAPGDDGQPGARFRPEHAGNSLLVAEREGLRVAAAGRVLRPSAGEALPVPMRFQVDDGRGLLLDVRWERVARAEPVVGEEGEILGYAEGPGIDLVVDSVEPGEAVSAGARVSVLAADGERIASVLVDGERPTLLHGRKERLAPLRGGILPPVAPDEELERAVRDGIEQGWIRVGPQTTAIEVPADPDGGPRKDLGWTLSRAVVDLLHSYDHSRAPVALRLGPGIRAAAATATVQRATQPLRWDGEVSAWLPSSLPGPGTDVVFDLPVTGGDGSVEVAAAFPLSWRLGGDDRWRAEPPPPRGSWARVAATAKEGDVLQVRLDAAPGEASPACTVAASVAGAPQGTFLREQDVRLGTRAFDGWDGADEDAAGLARRLWSRLPGDRWAVSGEAAGGGACRGERLYLRVPAEARSQGMLALDVDLPGAVLAARWNGEALRSEALPRAATGGRGRLSLPTRSGNNLLAIEVEMPASAPQAQAGGVRFVVDAEGRPIALDRRVADRRAHAAVRTGDPAAPAVAGREAPPVVVVEAGLPGLAAGTRWRIGSSAGRPGRSTLHLAEGQGTLARARRGALMLDSGGLTWMNGQARQGVVRRADSDPEGPPLAGFAVAPTALQPLRVPGDAIVGPDFRVALAAPGTAEIGGDRLVLAGGRMLALREDGSPVWEGSLESGTAAEAPGIRIGLATTDGRDLLVGVDRPARLWSAEGEPADLVPGEESCWPPGARLVVQGTALRLRRPLDAEADPMGRPDWAASLDRDAPLTIEPALQAAAERALDDELSRLDDDDGDTLALRGALLLWDPREGDVLACASRDRERADPRTRLDWPCWQDGGVHPGSTFKLATAGAALDSDDAAVRAMLDGDPPAELAGRGPISSLKGLALPPLPAGGDPIRLHSRLSNHDGARMPADADLDAALRGSFNTWFGYLGLLLHRPLREGWAHAGIAEAGSRLDSWPVARVARAAGFGRSFDLGAGATGSGGHVPEDAAPDPAIAARAIGQDAVTATPLGIARLVGAVADGGAVARPRLDSRSEVEIEPVMSAVAAGRLSSAMAGVVTSGTAARALSDNPWRRRMLGKTGSAQRIDGEGLGRTDAWFAAAMLPPEGSADSPVVIVCVLPGAGLGGRHAAEVVDAVSREVLRARGWGE